MQFDSRYQESKDGPLSKDVRARLQKFREVGFTLKDIGDCLGFSGPFISQLLNAKSPGRIRSIHIPKVVQAIERAEIENGIRDGVRPTKESSLHELPLEILMRAIEEKGFEVTVTPKSSPR